MNLKLRKLQDVPFVLICLFYSYNFWIRRRWIAFVCSMCSPFLADIKRNLLFQLSKTFRIISRSIPDHTSWESFQTPTIVLVFSIFSFQALVLSNRNQRSQVGFHLVIWQVCSFYRYKKFQVRSWVGQVDGMACGFVMAEQLFVNFSWVQNGNVFGKER